MIINQNESNQLKNILFITTSNLSTNPRLIKEVESAKFNGHSVSIICFDYNNWSQSLDKEWINKYPEIHVKKISANKKPLLIWILTSVLQKLCKLISKYSDSIYINALAVNKRSYQLIRNLISKLNLNSQKYDIIVGHNIGALYPSFQYAKLLNIPFVFDIEDYHPGELLNSNDTLEKRRRILLFRKLLPEASFLTFASPLIAKETLKLVGEKNIKRWRVINNCFLSSEFASASQIENLLYSSNIVHFVWFSQNIASNRGLEIIIPELQNFSAKVHLHLIGNLYDDFNKTWIKPNRHFITAYPPMPQKDLNQFICQFDVGLALEMNTADFNRQICLTNKIWAYLQAGLYILASDTPAQKRFIQEHQKSGVLFKQGVPTENRESIQTCIHYIIKNIELIIALKQERFNKAKNYSYENERNKLLDLWRSF